MLLTVLTRDRHGREPDDPRRTLRLSGLARVVGSLRAGPWDDPSAEVVPLDLAGLREALRRRGGCPIYGWEFVDAEGAYHGWQDKLSLDWPCAGPGGHHLTLFQVMGDSYHLDLRIWFAGLSVVDGAGAPIALDEFIEDGVRWWDAMYAGERSDLAPSIVALPERRRRWHRFRRTAR